MKDSKITTVLLGILVLFALGVILWQLQSVLLPFVVAVFFSYIFKPVVLFLRSRRIPMAVALIAVLLILSGLLFGLSMIVSSSVQSFMIEYPKYQMRLNTMIENLLVTLEYSASSIGLDTGSIKLTDAIEINSLTGIVATWIGAVFSFVGNFVLVMLFMLFILAGSGQMAEKVSQAFLRDQSHRIATIIGNIDVKVRQYLITKTLISLGTGTITAVILAIIGVDFALLWGFLAFLLNFIPNIGSMVAAVLPFIISLVQFESLTQPILVIVLLALTQNVMGNIVEPKLMSFSLNLSPLLILVSLIFWGWLWGVWGMILAVPIMSMVKIVFENIEDLKPVAVLMSGKSRSVKT